MFDIPSKKELEENSGDYSNTPLEPGNYIIKIEKIEIRPAPTFENRTPNYKVPTIAYNLVSLVYKMESGDPLIDIEGKEVAPLTKWIFRQVNPFSIGFQKDNATPSFMRGLLAIMLGVKVTDKLSPEDFVLLNKGLRVVQDKELKDRFRQELEDLKSKGIPSQLAAEGYQAIPEVRQYAGRYIGATLQIKTRDSGSENVISQFNKVPVSFVTPKPEEIEKEMEQFEKSYAKMVAKTTVKDREKFGFSPMDASPEQPEAAQTAPAPAPATPEVANATVDSDVIDDEMLDVEDVAF